MDSHVKIFPTVEQCRINNNLTCPVEECKQNFTSESNLNLHFEKTHNKSNLKSSPVDKQYFCPETNCPWSCSKHFKSMKCLRQHYLKVHTEKEYSCTLCQKSFASNALLSKHGEFCNITFACLDCNACYESYETLRTHCRRKKHRILNKCEYKMGVKPIQVKSEVFGKTYKLILPRQSSSEQMIVGSFRSVNIDQNSQTNEERPLLKSKMTQVTNENEFSVTQTTQHTQTGSKNVVLSVETQTIGDFFNRSKVDVFEDNFKNINTQTDIVESRESSSNTSFKLDDFEFTFNSHIEKSSSGTQTCWPDQDLFNMSTATHDTIHTDTSDLLADTDTLSNFDTNFFSNIETQTDFMFENEIFNSDYYSNMYTQTCDDILSGLNGFNDNQTQTVLNETLRSVESQTLMSSIDKLCPNVLKDIVHSQTQTDAEFRQMLEIINS